jgi:hypothetical protein
LFKNAERAVTLKCDEFGRFTALLGSSGTGRMIPLMLVVKVSARKTPRI